MDTSTEKLAQARKLVNDAIQLVGQVIATPRTSLNDLPRVQPLSQAINSLAYADVSLVEAGRPEISALIPASGVSEPKIIERDAA